MSEDTRYPAKGTIISIRGDSFWHDPDERKRLGVKAHKHYLAVVTDAPSWEELKDLDFKNVKELPGWAVSFDDVEDYSEPGKMMHYKG